MELDVEISDSENAVTGTVYNCDRVNVRKGPGTNYAIIGIADTGKTFEKSGAELLNGFTLHIDKPRASLLLKYVPQ